MNVTGVNTLTAIMFVLHICSALTVVTDHCRANTTLVSHVTESCKRFQTSFTIWICDVLLLTYFFIIEQEGVGTGTLIFTLVSYVVRVLVALQV